MTGEKILNAIPRPDLLSKNAQLYCFSLLTGFVIPETDKSSDG